MTPSVRHKRQAILDRWVDRIFSSYPPETAQFLRRRGDRFANPLSHVLASGASALLDGLLDETDDVAALDEILRVRAVQNFTPAEAVGFVFELKGAMAEEVGADSPELPELFEKTDRLALRAFDVYVRCREQLYQARLHDALGRPSPALQHASCSSRDCAACDPDARN